MIKLISGTVTLDAAGPDGLPRRSITGLAAPYGVEATVSDGTRVILEAGSLPVSGRNPKLFMHHDSTKVIGTIVERVDSAEGMYITARISATNLGNEALVLAADGVFELSVGINPTSFSYDTDGVMHVQAATFDELSLVAQGAWSAAQITQVAASIPQSEPESDNNEVNEPIEETTVSQPTIPAVEEVIPSAPIFAQAKRKFDLPTAGEYLAAMHIGGETFRNVSAAARDYAISKQSALQAAAGDVLTTDTVGLLNVNVLGPVFADLNYMRPVVAAIGARAMPDGGNSKTFIRPTWTTHPTVAAQSPELNAVSATTPVITSNVVTKTTLAGQVTLSVQDVDFTSPAAMQIIMQDLVGQYMLASDNVAADGIVAAAQASGATWTINQTDPTSLMTALYGAAVNILTDTNFLPDHIFVSPNVWELLGRQLDADKRNVFPYVGAAGLMGVNAAGSANITQMNTYNPFGLNLVADRNFASNTMIVARATALEFYEQVRGFMSVEAPSTLGKVLSYYSYVSFFGADADQIQSIALA